MTTTTTSTASYDDVMAALSAMAMYILLFSVIFYIFYALCLGRIFRKAGVPAWKAWVPILNSWKMLELGGQKGFWAILAFIPVINIVSIIFFYIAMYQIGVKLGKGGAFFLLAIFFPYIWLVWLALDRSTWSTGLAVAPEQELAPVADVAAPVIPTETPAPTMDAPVETPVAETPAPEVSSPEAPAPETPSETPQEESQTPPTPPVA